MDSLIATSLFCARRPRETCGLTILIALLSSLILLSKYQHDPALPLNVDLLNLASPSLISTTLSFNHHLMNQSVDSTNEQQLVFVQILAHPKGPFTATTKTALTQILKLQNHFAHNRFSVLDVASNRHLTYQDLCFRPGLSDPVLNSTSIYLNPYWKTQHGCLLLSPLAAWNNNLETLNADPNPALTLSNWSHTHAKDLDILLPIHLLNDPTNIPSASGAYLTFVLKATTAHDLALAHTFINTINSVSLDHGLIIADPLLHSISPSFSFPSKLSALGLSGLQWCMSQSIHILSVILHLIAKAEPVDVVVVFVAYAMMYATFGYLFFNMSKVGSRFILAASVMAYGTCALLVAMVISTQLFGVLLTPIMLAEALPFLVITVGFERPYLLAKAILLAQPSIDFGPGQSDPSHLSLHIHAKVAKAVAELGPNMVGELLLEVFVLAIGAASAIRGLSEFCLLGTLILLCDGIAMFTVFVSVVTLHLRTATQTRLTNLASRPPPTTSSLTNPTNNSPTALLPMTFKGRMTMATSFISYIKLALLVGVLSVHVWSILSPGVRVGTVFELFPRSQFVDVTSDHVRIPITWLQSYVSSDPLEIVVVPPIKFLLFDRALSKKHDQSVSIPPSLSTPTSMIWDFWPIVVLLLINVGLNAVMIFRQNDASQATAPPLATESSIDTPSTNDTSPVPVKSPNCSTTWEEPKILLETVPLDAVILKPDAISMARDDVPLSEHADDELVAMIAHGGIPFHSVEVKLQRDYERAIHLRRKAVQQILTNLGVPRVPQLSESALPYKNYEYEQVQGQCCENVIGYVPIPVGLAGPYLVDGDMIYIPMATTEGCLVASTSRGCKAITMCGGATTVLVRDGMTRGPCIEFPGIVQAADCRKWIESESGYSEVKAVFDSTSRFARLQRIQCAMAGQLLYVRFVTTTGDAMGMNMISKGCEQVVTLIQAKYPWAKVVAISGNYCTDKKPAAINWIEGRGKSVVASATVSGRVIESVLKTSAKELIAVNIKKNLVGSAMAGSIGGFNAHASNVLTAMYLATGQDPAQNVEASQCITLMELVPSASNDGQDDLSISVSMPCIEVGTVGGGTALGPQAAMLDLLGVRGAHASRPGCNAQRLACIIAASVMAGELSLMAALTAGHLVKSHMKHNRKPAPSCRHPC